MKTLFVKLAFSPIVGGDFVWFHDLVQYLHTAGRALGQIHGYTWDFHFFIISRIELSFLLIPAFLLTAASPTVAQPVNPCSATGNYSDCSSPTTATLSGSWYSGSGASSSPSCANSQSTGEYWVEYTAGSTYDMIRIGASTNNGGNWISDPAFEVYTQGLAMGCPTQPNISLVECVNKYSGNSEEAFFMSVTPGTTYYIRFFNADGPITGGSNGDGFEYCITEYLPGDFVCNAIDIGGMPFSYSGNTSGYTNHTQSPAFSPGGIIIGCSGKDYGIDQGPDVFFSYNSPGNEWIRVNLSGTTPSIYADLSILVATADPCNDTAMSNTQYASQLSGYGFLYECYNPPTSTFAGGFMAPGGSNGVDSATCRVIYLDTAGTYLFRMDADQSTNTTPFTIDLESYTPSNGDGCDNAIVLSDNVPQDVSNENCNYSWGPDDPDPADLCAGTIENTVWMSFTSDSTGADITIDISNINCSNADVVATGPPYGWYNYANAWQFGVVTGSCGGPYSSVLCQSGSTSTYNTTFTPTPNTTYYLVMDGNGGSECSWIITVSGGVTTFLPAELLHFDANRSKDDALIRWTAKHEERTMQYELQHSIDGDRFEKITAQKTIGTTDEPVSYTFTHESLPSGIHYYRLKQIDWDGVISYSSIRTVDIPEDGLSRITLFPNPASEQINVHYKNAGETSRVNLVSSSGHIIWQRHYNFSSNNSLQIPVQQFSPGIYFIEVHGASGIKRKQLIIH